MPDHSVTIKPVPSRKAVDATCSCGGWSASYPRITDQAEVILRGEFRLHKNMMDGTVERLCRTCDAQITKKPGPGRWPTRCEGCR